MSTDVRFFGGVDWASETHQVCLVAADGKIIGERAFAHGGAGLAEMCDWLVTTSGEEPPTVAVAIEVPHGPVVEILLERRFQVDAVNPKQLDRFRDQFTVAGAKDDRRDAYVLADALRTDRHCFRRLTVEDPVVIELREWSRMVEDLQHLDAANAMGIKQAHRRLDELSDKLAEGREEDAPGQKSKQRDVTILRSLPGVGRIVLATLLGEPFVAPSRNDRYLRNPALRRKRVWTAKPPPSGPPRGTSLRPRDAMVRLWSCTPSARSCAKDGRSRR